MLDEWITINEAIKMLEISRATIYRWSKSGILPIYTRMGKSRVKREDIEKILKEQFTPLHKHEEKK